MKTYFGLTDNCITGPMLEQRLRTSRLDDMVPEFRDVYNPDLDGAGTGTGLTAALDTGVYKTGASSLKLTCAAEGAGYVSINLNSSRYVKSGIVMRVRCDHWDYIEKVYVRLYEATSGAGHHYVSLAELSGGVVYDRNGMAAYPWENDTWRIIRLPRSLFAADSSPTGWGTSDSNAVKTVAKLYINLDASADGGLNLYVDRIWEERWPLPWVSILSDGFYAGFRDYIWTPLAANGLARGVNASMRTVSGTGIYPSWAQLQALLDAGGSRAVHMATAAGGTFTTSNTAAEVATAYAKWFAEGDANLVNWRRGKHFTQFLGNAGKYNQHDMAGVLRACGVFCSRGTVSDGTMKFSIDKAIQNKPRTTTYSPQSMLILDGQVPFLGQYNYSCTGWRDLGDTYKDDWTNQGLAIIDQARRHGLYQLGYVHNVEVGTVGAGNMGSQWAAGFVAYLLAYRNSFVFLTPEDAWLMTYGRAGPIYVSSTNEWLNRQDGSPVM